MSKAWGQVSITVTLIAIAVVLPFTLLAQTQSKTPPGLTTPDRVPTQIGTLEFKDGAPSAATTQKVYDNLDYIRGVDTTDDPFYGTSQHSSNESYHWTDGYGSYRNSNDSSYNPNQNENGNWQLMKQSQ